MRGLVLAFLLVALAALNAVAADWMFLDENDDSEFYYDKKGVAKLDVGKVRIKARAVYTEEGKADALKVLSKYPNMNNLAESQYSYEMDCIEKRSHLLDVQHLDKKGGVLRSSNLGAVTKWEAIDKGSRLEEIYSEVCPQ